MLTALSRWRALMSLGLAFVFLVPGAQAVEQPAKPKVLRKKIVMSQDFSQASEDLGVESAQTASGEDQKVFRGKIEPLSETPGDTRQVAPEPDTSASPMISETSVETASEEDAGLPAKKGPQVLRMKLDFSTLPPEVEPGPEPEKKIAELEVVPPIEIVDEKASQEAGVSATAGEAESADETDPALVATPVAPIKLKPSAPVKIAKIGPGVDADAAAKAKAPGLTPSIGPGAQSMGIAGLPAGGLGISYGYNPAGKTDPFKPLITATGKKTADEDKKDKKPKKVRPKTPLERYDLNQLKLVAIVHSPTRSVALVEEPSGKGYVIKPGTYVGTQEGKVAEILKDSVVVEELVEDLMGNVKMVPQILKIQTNAGEE